MSLKLHTNVLLDKKMEFIKNFKVGLTGTLLLVCALAVIMPVQAQTQDSTLTSDSAAVKQAADAASGVSSASAPLISTAVDTTNNAAVATSQPEEDRSPVYKSAAYYFLLFFLFCVFLAVIGRILKVYELSRGLQGKANRFDWRKVQGVLFGIALIAALYGTYWSYVHHGGMSVEESASVHGEEIDSMFMTTTVLTTIVFIITHILLFGFAYKYSGSTKKKAYFYPHNNSLERIWTIVPAIALTILVVLGFFTWRSITNVSPEDQKKALSIEVTGEQFKWNIRYAGNDNVIGNKNYKLITPTNNLGLDYTDKNNWDDKLAGEIVIPVNRPVRFTLGSKDVLHSFYIPEFRVQINTVPGMPTYFQFTPRFTTAEMREKRNNPSFNFTLLCNKICGEGHYNMQANVTVVSQSEYQEWAAKQQLFYNDDVKRELQQAELKKPAEADKIVLNKNNR